MQDLVSSKDDWTSFTAENDNCYTYTRSTESWTGFTSITTIKVEDGNVVKRSYAAFDGAQEQTVPISSYDETEPDQIGQNEDGFLPLCMDALYWYCEYLIAKGQTIQDATIIFTTFDNNIMKICGYIPSNCMDDCFQGISIDSIVSCEEDEEEELPPTAFDDDIVITRNTAIIVDVLRNDIDPDQPELSGKETLIISEFTNGNKGSVELIDVDGYDTLRYTPNLDECGDDLFTYTIQDDDQGFTDIGTVYVTIRCSANGAYDDNYQKKKRKIDSLDRRWDQALTEKDKDKWQDNEDKIVEQEFCVDVEYEGKCSADNCDSYRQKISGRDGLKQYFGTFWEIMAFDNVTMDYDDNMLMSVKYRKGKCEGKYTYNVEVKYDLENDCISRWVVDFDTLTIMDKDGLIDYENNSIDAFLRKLETKCQSDDENSEYIADKEDKVEDTRLSERKFIDKLDETYNHVMNAKDNERADDTEVKEELCVDIEYEAICTIQPECTNYATKVIGREAFVKLGQELYTDLFDEITMVVDDTFTLMTFQYRKGECEGEYRQKIEEHLKMPVFPLFCLKISCSHLYCKLLHTQYRYKTPLGFWNHMHLDHHSHSPYDSFAHPYLQSCFPFSLHYNQHLAP